MRAVEKGLAALVVVVIGAPLLLALALTWCFVALAAGARTVRRIFNFPP